MIGCIKIILALVGSDQKLLTEPALLWIVNLSREIVDDQLIWAKNKNKTANDKNSP